MKYGKAFGAVKTAVIRTIRRGGYSPRRTQITVYEHDRARLRKYCKDHGGLALIEGMSNLLDEAKVKKPNTEQRDGSLKNLIKALTYKAKEFSPDKLIARIKTGEFDEFIYESTRNN